MVEDNPVNQEVVREMLTELGHEVELVENGKLAVEASANADFALVLMDCQMPVMNGYDATRAIRAREGGGPRTPIIGLTAHAMRGDAERATSIGMDDYLTKPITMARLRDVVAHWIDGAGAREPAPSAEAPATVLDPAVQRSARVLTLALAQLPKSLSRVTEAARSGDHEALAREVHKLKGSCLALGAGRLAAICAAAQERPADLDIGELEAAARELTVAMEGESKARAAESAR